PLGFLAALLDLLLGEDAAEDLLRRDLPVADAGEHRVLVLQRELACHAGERPVGAEPSEVERVAGEIALEDLAADGDRARRLLTLHPGPHARLGTRRLDELQPVLRRRLARRGDDLHRVAALQLVAQRYDAAVHARAGA